MAAYKYIVGYNDLGNPIYSNDPSDIPGYSGNDSSAKFGATSGGLQYDPNNNDSYLNAVNQQALWHREDMLRRGAEIREDYAMDRIVAAAKRNGINPVFLIDALSGNAGNAASYTTSAAKANNYDTNARTDQATSAKLLGALIAALAAFAAMA